MLRIVIFSILTLVVPPHMEITTGTLINNSSTVQASKSLETSNSIFYTHCKEFKSDKTLIVQLLLK